MASSARRAPSDMCRAAGGEPCTASASIVSPRSVVLWGAGDPSRNYSGEDLCCADSHVEELKYQGSPLFTTVETI